MRRVLIGVLVLSALGGATALGQDLVAQRATSVFGTTVAADLPTSCAESFSARLSTERSAQVAWIESHPADVPWVQIPNAENAACAAEDARHRIVLVVPDGADPVVALVKQQILCYGDDRPSCRSAFESIGRARAAIRSRLH